MSGTGLRPFGSCPDFTRESHGSQCILLVDSLSTQSRLIADVDAVWGLCFSIAADNDQVGLFQNCSLVFLNWLCFTMIHGCFCTWK
jgi:hypothetical protein